MILILEIVWLVKLATGRVNGAACNMGCSWAGVSVCETDEGMSCKVELMELHVTWVALGQESPFVRLTKVCPVRLS